MYGPQNLTIARHARLAGPSAGIARHRDRPAGRAVIAAVGRQHLVPAGVAARHADGVLGGFRPTVGEEHLVEVAGRQLGDQPGRLAAGVVGVERGDRAELVGLLLDRGDEPGVLVADVDVDELAGEVEPRPSALVPEPRAEGAGDDHGIEQRLRRPRVEDVGAVVAVDGGDLLGGGRVEQIRVGGHPGKVIRRPPGEQKPDASQRRWRPPARRTATGYVRPHAQNLDRLVRRRPRPRRPRRRGGLRRRIRRRPGAAPTTTFPGMDVFTDLGLTPSRSNVSSPTWAGRHDDMTALID